MSSLIRRIQRAPHRTGKAGNRGGVHFMGRGTQLGTRNPKAKDLLARQAREAKRREAKANG